MAALDTLFSMVLASFTLGLVPSVAATQESGLEERLEAQLSAARRRYDSELASAKSDLALAAQEAIEAASGGSDPARAAQLQMQLDAFQKRGELPTSLTTAVQAFEQARRDALTRLAGGYEGVIGNFRTFRMGMQVAATEKALAKLLADHDDQLWNDLLCAAPIEATRAPEQAAAGAAGDVPAWTRSGRTLVSSPRGRCTITIPLPKRVLDYDLELVVTRATGGGPLDFWIPVGRNYRRLRLDGGNSVAPDGGDGGATAADAVLQRAAGPILRQNAPTTLLLSMRDERLQLLVDGRERTLQPSSDGESPLATAQPNSQLAMDAAEGSSFSIRSARLKWLSIAPVAWLLTGEAPNASKPSSNQPRGANQPPSEDPAQRPGQGPGPGHGPDPGQGSGEGSAQGRDPNAKKPAAPANSTQGEQQYRAGLTWSGKRADNSLADIKLLKHDGTHIEFEVEGDFAGSSWTISGELKDGKVTVNDIDKRKGKRMGHSSHPRGWVKINADGTLSMNCKVEVDYASRKNKDEEFVFTKAKEK